MKEINIDNLPRKKTYEWFRKFDYSTYGVSVKIDVTNLVKHCKENKESFFIDMLYIMVNALNSVKELKMRLYNGKPVIYDDINPAITVMTNNEVFENVRFKNYHNFKEFYKVARKLIDEAKNEEKLNDNNYNPDKIMDEYYITCLPWIDFTNVTHPYPSDIDNQTIPRICFGKYTLNNDKYEMMLNISVSHIFVDGLHLSKVFDKVNELLDDVEDILK